MYVMPLLSVILPPCFQFMGLSSPGRLQPLLREEKLGSESFHDTRIDLLYHTHVIRAFVLKYLVVSWSRWPLRGKLNTVWRTVVEDFGKF